MSRENRLMCFLKIMHEKGAVGADNAEIAALRLCNGLKVLGYCDELEKRGITEKLIDCLCEEKMAFAAVIKTKHDEEELWKRPRVYSNGNEFVPSGRYHCEAEELLMWSETSLRAPLAEQVCNRMLKLFQKYFGMAP